VQVKPQLLRTRSSRPYSSPTRTPQGLEQQVLHTQRRLGPARIAGIVGLPAGYAEVLPREQATTATGFWARAQAFFAGHGVVLERALTDNGSRYRSRRWRQQLAGAGACRADDVKGVETCPVSGRVSRSALAQPPGGSSAARLTAWRNAGVCTSSHRHTGHAGRHAGELRRAGTAALTRRLALREWRGVLAPSTSCRSGTCPRASPPAVTSGTSPRGG
jgi:hypothetical protein